MKTTYLFLFCTLFLVACSKSQEEYIKDLTHEDPHIVTQAVKSLGEIGVKAKSVIPQLLSLGLSKDSSIRAAVQKALKQIDVNWFESPKAQEMIPELVDALDKDDLREDATVLLIAINHSKAIPVLVDALPQKYTPEGQNALLEVLKGWEKHSKQVIPHMIKLLMTSKDYAIINSLGNGLSKIDPSWRTSPELRKFFPDLPKKIFEEKEYKYTKHLLSHINNWPKFPQTKKLIPFLIKKFSNKKLKRFSHEEWEHRTAFKMLNAIDPNWYQLEETKACISDLIQGLASKDIHSIVLAALNKVNGDWKKHPSARKIILDIIPQLPVESTFLSFAKKSFDEIDPNWRKYPNVKPVVIALGKSFIKNEWSRKETLKVLSIIQPEIREAIPYLIDRSIQITGDDPRQLIKLLSNFDDKEIIDYILRYLNPYYSSSVINTLKKKKIDWSMFRELIPKFTQGLVFYSGSMKAYVEEVLPQIDPNWISSPEAETAIPSIIEALWNVDNKIHSNAKQFLTKFKSKATIVMLTKAFFTKRESKPKYQEYSFKTYDYKDVNIEFIKQLLNDIDPKWASYEFTQKILILGYAKRLRSHAGYPKQITILEKLAKINPNWNKSPFVEPAIPYIAESLKSDDWSYRCHILYLLLVIGPKSVVVIDAIIKQAADPNKEVRRMAMKTLVAIESEKCVPTLVKGFSDRQSQYNIIQGLAKLGPKARIALPKLIEFTCNEPTVIYRSLAIQALEKIDSNWRQSQDAEHNISLLIKSLLNDSVKVRNKTKDTLDIIDSSWQKREATKKLVTQLIENLGKSDSKLKAIDILGKLKESAEPAVYHLLMALVDQNEEVRAAAKMSLEAIPNWFVLSEAKKAIVYLKEALTRDDKDIKYYANFALNKLENPKIKE
ncbi:HEAT repeat domain-containing protein [Candidatus Uabimicrobium sp. HlEnr_7]|uniref:HEAT repeat domain-containing protein n=1 Tax=Candidatus Uabimicrobium helgolandensis TaxID=3095367 RepID=UPI003555C93D